MDKFVQYWEHISSAHRLLYLLGGMVLFWIAEGYYPLFKHDYRRYRHAGINLIFLFTTVVLNLIFGLATLGVCHLVTVHKIGLINWLPMPVWLVIPVGLLLGDLFSQYIPHYIMHKVKWMWKFHMVHHSDTHVDVTTGTRHHPGEWVFREAARQVQLWRDRFDPRFQISVNKSPVQFHSAHKSRQGWFDFLAALALPGNSIVVEITEGLLLNADPGVADHLLALSDAGIGVSLDDFGTGYSALSSLKLLPFDRLKIDRSFVQDLQHDADARALCRAIIAMGRSLNMEIIAEGVETYEQLAFLREEGCDEMQGYLIGAPMSADEMAMELSAHTKGVLARMHAVGMPVVGKS